MEQYAIVSLNVGKPETLFFEGKQLQSAINKVPVEGTIFLSKLHCEGDVQVNLVHHGGVDKAICFYSYKHYSYWEQFLGKSLSVGAFGENVTVESLTEEDVCIGDIFQLGEALLQVSQPRQPCAKLGMKHQSKELVKQVQQTGYSGFYCRVIKEGGISKQDNLILKERHPSKISIAYINNAMFRDDFELKEIERIIAVEELSESWRIPLSQKL